MIVGRGHLLGYIHFLASIIQTGLEGHEVAHIFEELSESRRCLILHFSRLHVLVKLVSLLDGLMAEWTCIHLLSDAEVTLIPIETTHALGVTIAVRVIVVVIATTSHLVSHGLASHTELSLLSINHILDPPYSITPLVWLLDPDSVATQLSQLLVYGLLLLSFATDL